MKLSQVEGHNTQTATTTDTEDNSSAKATAATATASASVAVAVAEKSNVEHAANNEAKNGDAKEAPTTAPATATTTTTTGTEISTTMTDERSNSNNNHPSSSSNIKNNNNNNNHNNSSSSDNSNIDEIPRPDSERIIAEAAKILLKNRLNGANAAAAAVVTASLLSAANFQTPAIPTNSREKTTRGTLFQPPSAAYLGGGLPVVSAARISSSNGVSSTVCATTHSFTGASQSHKKAMAASACTQPPVAHMGIGSVKSNIGVIDYTVNASSTSGSGNNNKSLNSRNVDNSNSSSNKKYTNSNSDNSSDANRNSISPISGNASHGGVSSNNNSGGRLHIFKDGKLVLELASGGEKSGWVSVPRKLFHAPSATSSTITPTLATATAYPKNESSTSLSFSDDNSSIQSSPWQRDHCWKQVTPCRGISKAFSLWYQRPKGATLTRKAVLAAQRKRRRPTRDQHTVAEIFEYAPSKPPRKHCLKENNTNSDAVAEHKSSDVICVKSPKVERMESDKSGGELSAEDDGCSTSSTATLTGGRDCTDGAITDRKTPTPNSPSSDLSTDQVRENAERADKVKVEKTEENAVGVGMENMSTSDDDEEGICASMYVSVSMDENEQKDTKLNGQSTSAEDMKSKVENKTADKFSTKKQLATKRGEEKRLKKQKTRAKLNTIIQKLIDTMPTRMAQASTRSSHSSGAGSGNNANHNSQTHKVSPPTSSTTSRLVDYPQQHVSPRKRILREFEKVSLEDNAASCSTVVHTAKRSRAKSNASLSSTGASSSYNAKSSPNRAQNCVTTTNTASPSTPTTTNGTQRNITVKAESSITSSPTPTPTRLNSSYSIHSLLSGSSSSSSSSSSANALSKRPNDPAIISNFSYQLQQQQQQQQHYTDPSYLRSMLASPKSPEGSGSMSVGGKSPSHSASKKRSPPYASPLRDFHARSPTVAHSGGDYGRRSPHLATHETAAGSYKLRYAADHSGGNSAAQSSSSHLPQHSGFYSPFMLSAMPNTSVSPNSSAAAQCTTRSPRHHATNRSSPIAFSSASATASTSTTSSSFSSSTTANIPNVANSHGNGSGSGGGGGMQRELSSPRMLSSSPRDNTPRTVPKKTASIRRQFASPTASTTSSSCPSPSEQRTNHEEITGVASANNNNMSAVQQQQSQQQQHGRKTPFASATAAAHSLQRTSPSGALGSAVPSPFHYYMYPGAPNGVAASSHALGSAAYIPQMAPSPFYAPYINAIAAIQNNSVFMQHAYAQHMLPPHHLAAASPAARLPPPFGGFGYNGLSAAVMANAMQQQQQQQQHQMHGHSALQQSVGHGLPMSVSPVSIANAPMGRRPSPKSMESSAAERQAGGARSTGTTPTSMASGTIYASSIKDEHSSDVPLNLSKH